jgi:hypothetical protein
MFQESWDSAVGIATGYGFEVPVPVGSRIFSSLRRPYRLWGSTLPPNKWVPGGSSLEVKRPGREADHLPPTSAQVKKTWINTFTSPYVFMA